MKNNTQISRIWTRNRIETELKSNAPATSTHRGWSDRKKDGRAGRRGTPPWGCFAPGVLANEKISWAPRGGHFLYVYRNRPRKAPCINKKNNLCSFAGRFSSVFLFSIFLRLPRAFVLLLFHRSGSGIATIIISRFFYFVLFGSDAIEMLCTIIGTGLFRRTILDTLVISLSVSFTIFI